MNDRLLMLLIKSVEEHEGSDATPPFTGQITLTVGGILVSGFIISAAIFLQANETIYGPIIRPILPQEGESSDDEPPFLEFIHLRDAKFYLPGANHPIPTSSAGTYWRGKISRMDGFFLGTLDLSVTRR